jgi:hypothetical protein
MAWKPPINYRLTAVVTPTPEAFTIDASGVALLAEAPADPAAVGTPMTVLVGGVPYTRVTGSPAAGTTTFRVKSQTVMYADLQSHTEYLPLLEFHPERALLTGTCSYYRTGTVYTAEWFAALMAHLTPLVGVADETGLPPATTDVSQRGYPGDQAFLEDGSMYFSDGNEWLMTAGGAGTPRTRRPAVAADAAVQERGLLRVVDADARVAELFVRTASVTADAWVAAANQRQASVTADALVSGSVLKSVPADAYAVSRVPASVAADAAVRASIAKTVSADAAVSGTATKYINADARVITDEITSPAPGEAVSGSVVFQGTATPGAVVEIWDTGT